MKDRINELVEKYGLKTVAEACMVTERTIRLAMTQEKRVISEVRMIRAEIKLNKVK